MAATIDPRFMDVVRWANQTSLILVQYGPVMQLSEPDEWKTWARYVISLPTISALTIPRPDAFERWQDWADQFNHKVELLPTI